MPRPPASTQRDWYTTPEVAELFGVTSYTVRVWIRQGKLKANQVNTLYRIPREEVIRWGNEKYHLGE